MKRSIFFLSIYCLFLFSNTTNPIAWSKGEPIWKEGEPLPPEGQSWIVICARKKGILENNPTEDQFFRPLESMSGHAWLERIRSDGTALSVSTQKDPSKLYVNREDYVTYKFDKDTFRLAYLVPDSLADQVCATAESYAMNGYNFLFHNCVHTTGCGANVAGLGEFFENIFPSHSENGTPFEMGRITTPSSLYSALETKVYELQGWNHPILNPANEVKNQIVWVYLASDDHPGSFFPPASLQLEKDYSIAMLPTRGNYGGICFSKRADFSLKLDEIYGAIFDETTQQIILIGKKTLHLPDLKLDDLAVAMHSIYGLKGKQPEDPGVSIDPTDGDQMVVRYFGETQNTAFGKTLFEGDYTLKMLGIGEYPCHVPGFVSFVDRVWAQQDLVQLLSCNCRTWIIPEKISLVESPDGSSMVFQETKMQCLAEDTCKNPANPNVSHQEFVRHFTDHYDAISEEYPIFTEIKRLGQITAVVKWLKDHNIPFDYSFFQSYTPPFVETPTLTPKILVKRSNPSSWIQITGGILFGLQNYSSSKDASTNSFKEKIIAARPDELTFNWEIENLSAQAFPFVKTKKL